MADNLRRAWAASPTFSESGSLLKENATGLFTVGAVAGIGALLWRSSTRKSIARGDLHLKSPQQPHLEGKASPPEDVVHRLDFDARESKSGSPTSEAKYGREAKYADSKDLAASASGHRHHHHTSSSSPSPLASSPARQLTYALEQKSGAKPTSTSTTSLVETAPPQQRVSKSSLRRGVVDGNQGASHVAYGLSDLVVVLPLSSDDFGGSDVLLWADAGKVNSRGRVVHAERADAAETVATIALGSVEAPGTTQVSAFVPSAALRDILPSLRSIARLAKPFVLHVACQSFSEDCRLQQVRACVCVCGGVV